MPLRLLNKLRPLAITAATAGMLAMAGGIPAWSGDFDSKQKSEIEGMIREYILNNPDVVYEALVKHREKQIAAEEARKAEAMAGINSFFQADPYYPRTGNVDGDVQMVEFFDYQCGYCKRVFPTVMDVVDEDKNVGVIMVEFPVLGPVSEFASRAALASKTQGKYMEYHVALMEARGRLSETKIMSIAEEVGLDTDQLREDMQAQQVSNHIMQNRQLAETLGIRGTPAFIIGSQLAPGAIDKAQMINMIKTARKNS